MKKHLVTLLASAIGAAGLVGGSVSIKPAQPLPAYEKSVIWNDLILPKDYGWWDAFRVADLNADGRSDLAIVWGQTSFPVTEPLQIGIYLQDAVGNLVGKADYPINASRIIDLIAEDFNDDGIPDILGNDAWNDSTILLGKGDGTFEQPRWLGINAVYFPEIVDLNKDNKLDLIAGSLDGSVRAFLGNGDGSFAPGTDLATSIEPVNTGGGEGIGAILAGDINRDGKPDVIISMPHSQDTRVGQLDVCFGNGDGTFQTPIRTEGVAAFRGALGDFNGDGIPDYAGDRYAPEELQIWLGQKDGHFVKRSSSSLSGFEPVEISAIDLNGDGLLDISVACEAWQQPNFSAPLAIFLGRGDGTLSARQSYTPGANLTPINRAAQFVDFDRDGRLDLLALAIDENNNVQGVGGLTLGRNSGTALNPAAGFQVSIEGSENAAVILEKSSDLSSWLPLTTNSAPTGSWSIIDPAPGVKGFYRTRNAP